ncbi:hypothetical protein TVAG_263060 [Trichomonas vaginalis G3]|uniref:Uncharacterized protein n=1 Tax=Trichomonas vaginalis (strain ATCC PRA-98 / G3) TaxID=412133 RepID=A2FA53_TRIV3|nr:hypothetical protein TVAGG3_0386880 [Trichomonas vaginalis G3]EAX98189.1 hypothetical protein TVAG_263060 [Trichomonas vaginalis G3]KAI5533703.1 hypothetical protein TVAGG3_0386880 [Trichomonas vaginalis G3]|eukprot:XP_001311119.1 hypothetical protein [Trichomonas vaginalis G3]
MIHYGCIYTSSRVNFTKSINTAYGPFENGLIIKFFRGNITTLQWWWNYEIPGHHIFLAHRINRYLDPQVVSIRIPEAHSPWIDKSSTSSLMWINEATELYNSIGEKLPTASLDIINAKKLDIPVQKTKKKPFFLKLFKDDPNVQPSRFYLEFHEITDQQFYLQCVLIILSSIGFVAYALTASNRRQPWPIFSLSF